MHKHGLAQRPRTKANFPTNRLRTPRPWPNIWALTQGFESGSIAVFPQDLELVLSPKGLIGFAVEAKGKDGRMKLTLNFTWREGVSGKEPRRDPLEIEPGDAQGLKNHAFSGGCRGKFPLHGPGSDQAGGKHPQSAPSIPIELVAKIESRDDYIDNLKSILEERCFSRIHGFRRRQAGHRHGPGREHHHRQPGAPG